MSSVRLRLLALPLSLACASSAHAVSYASRVVSYTPGSASPTWSNPAAVLGGASALTGENPAASNYFGFPNILSPFSPAYQGDEIVQIGEGGQLTLQLSNFALVGSGRELGIFSNVGLIDADYPNGANTSPATHFGGGSAQVSVSADNINWVSLGSRTFDMPSFLFPDASPYLTSPPPGPLFANFGLPMPSPFSCFDGHDWTKTQNCFVVSSNVWSAGGDWLDLASSGLSQVGYVRFEIPSDGNPNTDLRLAIDTVAVNNASVGAPVPEPASLLLLLPLAALVFGRRRGC
ncbi:MAG TPA: hypothetical protein VGQ99_07180 [Tepidisphaeraceae bacterium]|jgi:hypothetical protein|nr:hypothetical protein [Tepidisphaeraceae bacterium]